MKILTAVVGVLLAASLARSADNPVNWTVTGNPQKPVAAGAPFTVKLHAEIAPEWHLYGLEQEDGGPVPTEISLPGDSFLRMGSIRASKPVQLLDPNFNKQVSLYVDKAEFSIPLKVAAGTPEGKQPAKLQVRYQCCSGTMCLPPRMAVLEFPVLVKAK